MTTSSDVAGKASLTEPAPAQASTPSYNISPSQPAANSLTEPVPKPTNSTKSAGATLRPTTSSTKSSLPESSECRCQQVQ
ncbi:hypothetical protein NEOLEDRAFT_634791 [Neolentinus lepideus HHB14362 ss-1]|uniref:Uncharacterized protein n=1 Tax=Neolentinus lepideus HHB14362 ss-1 TaxID=1314782 RepID=A0A165QMU0_9AGAM|nr:hypothetical protein NEOLEDRAFT_634791 [Neolentinus lepideus HHB14362 ss-1]